MNLYGFAGGDPVNFSDPMGLCPACAFAEGGAYVGTLILPGPGTVIGAVLGGAVGVVGGHYLGKWLSSALSADNAEPSSDGAKSAEEFDRHVGGRDRAQEEVGRLKEKLGNVKGPKAQKPIREQIEQLEKDIRGHEKEIRQKWPNGRPE